MTKEEFIQSITLPEEEWRDVVGREGSYIVSNFARIATVRNYYEYKRNGKTFQSKMSPHICSTSIAPSTPYRRMTFVEGGKHTTELVHVVVARAFIPNPNNYPCVDHIDDNPENNSVSNLQWCSYSINNSKPRHRARVGNSKRGRVDPKRIPIIAIKDGAIIKQYDSMHAARLEGHHASAMLRVIRGKLKTHHGFQWAYATDYKSLINMSKNSNLNSKNSYAASGETSCKMPE